MTHAEALERLEALAAEWLEAHAAGKLGRCLALSEKIDAAQADARRAERRERRRARKGDPERRARTAALARRLVEEGGRAVPDRRVPRAGALRPSGPVGH